MFQFNWFVFFSLVDYCTGYSGINAKIAIPPDYICAGCPCIYLFRDWKAKRLGAKGKTGSFVMTKPICTIAGQSKDNSNPLERYKYHPANQSWKSPQKQWEKRAMRRPLNFSESACGWYRTRNRLEISSSQRETSGTIGWELHLVKLTSCWASPCVTWSATACTPSEHVSSSSRCHVAQQHADHVGPKGTSTW